jgi:hypothetical protein
MSSIASRKPSWTPFTLLGNKAQVVLFVLPGRMAPAWAKLTFLAPVLARASHTGIHTGTHARMYARRRPPRHLLINIYLESRHQNSYRLLS